jgi:predicted DNA-binding transcriptional regulator AlpA
MKAGNESHTPAIGAGSEANRRGPGTLEHLWTVQDVCDYTGMSASWVYHRAAAGLVPRVYIGSKLRFVAEEVRAWALSQRKVPRPPTSTRKAEA